MSHISIDFVISLPLSYGNTTILTMVDRCFLRWPMFYYPSSLLPRKPCISCSNMSSAWMAYPTTSSQTRAPSSPPTVRGN
ncbi:hypothetical protein QTP70_020333 [Hemibagrus guttatus]|uniref:Uncharacterized protein n=1 Tax=Hemibagrus guttatus TaxID=175788 RepID=A0AAE0RBE9_9TELE|nr:hypothetical protein QTP70_020333 [Hemibagrus guttatus]